MLKRLRVVIEKAIVFVFDMLEYMRDVWDVRVLKRHRMVLRESHGQQPRPARISRFAIVALYPTNESLPSTINLLRILHSSGFFVLAVSTRKLSDTMRTRISPNCHHLIERVGVGRDFGSYKMGLEWLEEQKPPFKSIETLLLANDSLFFPLAFEKTFKEILREPSDWQCLFENFEHHYHAQSFFLLFTKNVFSSNAFKAFWNQYKPYSSRRHSINHGEVKFSAALRQAGYISRAAFSSGNVYGALLEHAREFPIYQIAELSPSGKSWQNNRNKIFDSALSLLRPHRSARNQDFDDEKNHKKILNYIEQKKWFLTICRKAEQSNPTHGLALLANHLFAGPIKRDICYRGSYDIAQILMLAHGFSNPELEAMAADLNRRGLASCFTGIRKILWKYGRL